MIAADREELESRLKQATLQIREKEVTVFTENFAVISTQAAFLTGLGFSGLTMVPTWARTGGNTPMVFQIAFYSLVSVGVRRAVENVYDFFPCRTSPPPPLGSPRRRASSCEPTVPRPLARHLLAHAPGGRTVVRSAQRRVSRSARRVRLPSSDAP